LMNVSIPDSADVWDDAFKGCSSLKLD